MKISFEVIIFTAVLIAVLFMNAALITLRLFVRERRILEVPNHRLAEGNVLFLLEHSNSLKLIFWVL